MTADTASHPQSRDDLERTRRALGVLRAANRALLRATDETWLVQEICRIMVEDSGYRFAWVGFAEHDEQKSVRPVAHAGFEDGYLAVANISWADSERGQGPTGTAIRTGKPAIVRDMLTDPNVAPWREDARKRGYASAASLPLLVENETIGVLNIRAAEPDAFKRDELDLLIDTADDLAYGIQVLRNRAKHEEAEATIRRMSLYDSVTGLPNRVRMRQVLEQSIGAARHERRPLALLMVGAHRFSEINEALGYREGDRLLQEMAVRLQKLVPDADAIARVGEADFAVVASRSDAEHARQLSAEILTAMYEPIDLAGFTLDPRANIGISLFPGHGSDPDVLIRRAHVALQQARRTSSGYAIYTGGLDTEGTHRLEMMADLRNAIQNNELLLYCQPKIGIRAGRLAGAEALVRWPHRDKGMINPGEFIKLAESTGLITPLTFWMLDNAVAQGYAWREQGLDAPLAVNLSARDLHDPTLLERVRNAFLTWGAQPDWLQFELTESAVMDDPDGSLDTLRRLKDLGVQLFIDDFGTGYSSLSYLQKMPVDAIKVDQSFVGDMLQNEDSAAIVRSTIELAHNLGMKVVAEGVETAALWRELETLGCDVAQGYFISAPIPADQLGPWLRRSAWSTGAPATR